MSGTTGCPTADNLHRFLLGQVDEDEAALVQDHLSGCDQCLDTMAHLSSDDTLVVAMRAQAQAAADPDEALVEKLVHQLSGLHQRPLEPTGELPRWENWSANELSETFLDP